MRLQWESKLVMQHAFQNSCLPNITDFLFQQRNTSIKSYTLSPWFINDIKLILCLSFYNLWPVSYMKYALFSHSINNQMKSWLPFHGSGAPCRPRLNILQDKWHWIDFVHLSKLLLTWITMKICNSLVMASPKWGIILYEYQMKFTEYESHLTAWIMLDKASAAFKPNIAWCLCIAPSLLQHFVWLQTSNKLPTTF